MTFTPATLREIVERGDYTLLCDERQLEPDSFGGLRRIEDTVGALLKKYLGRLYDIERSAWEQEHLCLRDLDAADPNLAFKFYEVRAKPEIAEKIRELVRKGEELYRQDIAALPTTIHFDRHLYQPLLIKDPNNLITSEPEGLEPSETQFVDHLRDYWRHYGATEHAGCQVFLLRNLSRGKGIGFFKNAGFYPDFILWIKKGKKQRVVFIDPHGMRHEKAPEKSDRVNLYRLLATLSESWRKKPRARDVTLDSYIISDTPYDELSDYYTDGRWTREDFISRHILFP